MEVGIQKHHMGIIERIKKYKFELVSLLNVSLLYVYLGRWGNGVGGIFYWLYVQLLYKFLTLYCLNFWKFVEQLYTPSRYGHLVEQNLFWMVNYCLHICIAWWNE